MRKRHQVVRAQGQLPLKQKAGGDGFPRTSPSGRSGLFSTSTWESLPLAERRKLMRSSAAEDPLRGAFNMALGPDSDLQDEALSIALRRIRAGDMRFSFVL